MKDYSKEILAYALQNAIEYGKADSGKVLPKLFQHGLKKEDIKEIMIQIKKGVDEVNKMSSPEREKAFSKISDLVVKREEKERGLPEIDLSGVKKVVTRLAPEPSKYTHLGHALSFLLNYAYAKKYDGKCLLRFEDTNPEKAKKEYVDAMKEDVLDYLGIKVDEIRFVSDDMKILYDYAEKLINKGNAYICFCDRDKMQDLRHKGIECSCREFPLKINEERWKLMLKGGFKEGEATLRLKGDMQNKNQVMRDPVLFRTMYTKHYRHGTKYKVWPMYDFYNPIEDSLMGVTLILRSNEFDLRVELQDKLKELLGLKKQKIVQYGRFNVKEFTTKGREIADLIKSGKYSGWDDPRLITLKALKRRGILREAYYELLNNLGLAQNPVNLEFEMIGAINRKIVDSKADRYSFVENPVELKIKGSSNMKEIEIQVHPDKKETRKIKIGKIFISKKDYGSLKGKEIRLIHLYNIKLGTKSEITSVENKNIPKINWVSDSVKAKVLMPDGKEIEGLVEKAASELKKDSIVQFERFGFVRFEKKTKESLDFVFSHR